MSKLSIARLQDITSLVNGLTKAGVEGADAFVTFVTDFSDQIISALRNRLTIEENLSSTVKDVTLSEATNQVISFDKKLTPKHVFATKCRPFSTAVTAFNWEMTQSGDLRVRASFLNAPTTLQTVTLVILY